MTLTEFLLARIDEDADEIENARISESPDWWEPAQWNRARVLAEVEAWRKIIELHRPRYAVMYHEADRLLADAFDSITVPTVAHSGPIWPTPESEETLRALASVHADHADFDPRWAL
jgi:hypothetical protein